METRSCVFCGDDIPYSRNKNSRYCCHECYYENKKNRAAETNKLLNQEKILLFNDKIVEAIYEQYFEKKYILYISSIELIKNDFDWSIYSGEIIIEGIKAKKLLRYAYTLFTNQTVRIWKL